MGKDRRWLEQSCCTQVPTSHEILVGNEDLSKSPTAPGGVASPMTLVLDSGDREFYCRGMKVTVTVHGVSEVNPDAQLIAGGSAALRRTEEKLIEMTHGCIRCTLRDVSSKSRLLSRVERGRRVRSPESMPIGCSSKAG